MSPLFVIVSQETHTDEVGIFWEEREEKTWRNRIVQDEARKQVNDLWRRRKRKKKNIFSHTGVHYNCLPAKISKLFF